MIRFEIKKIGRKCNILKKDDQLSVKHCSSITRLKNVEQVETCPGTSGHPSADVLKSKRDVNSLKTPNSSSCLPTSKSKMNFFFNLNDSSCGSDSLELESPIFKAICSTKHERVTSPEEGELSESSENCDPIDSEAVDKDELVRFAQRSSPQVSKIAFEDAPLSESFKQSNKELSKTAVKDIELTQSPKHCKPKLSVEAFEDGDLSPENCKGDIKSKVAVPDVPPLVMQSTNLPNEDGLDVRHDGGGNETSSGDSSSEPPKKKRKEESNNVSQIPKSSFELDISDNTEYLLPYGDHNYSKIEKISGDPELENEQSMDMDINDQSRVMEFDILDEFECNDNDDRESEYDSDISLDELDAMLEAGFENGKTTETTPFAEGFEHEEKEKVILNVKGRDHFDVLPEGWIEVTHNSGMPVYLHKATRVCCVSKPYFLGPGSTRKHEIPVSAIPCLHYSKELEKESHVTPETTEEADAFPPAKLESVKDTKESGSLDYLAVREYCKKRFEFQTITVKRFKTWSGRRRHQKQMRMKQRPTLPDSTKLITCPLPPTSDKASTNGNNSKREFIMNPSGKSPVCILHEYVQHTLRLQPIYIFKELENASTPYGAVVLINDMEYGSGYGSSKKIAKSEAAKAALDVLIPKMKMFAPDGQWDEQQDVEFFDQVRVEDPRVCELSVKAGQPYPFQILLECLKRNYGMGDTEIDFQMRNLKHQKNEFVMSVGKHTASVVCKNKRDGKHRASQAILQMLHPHISSWGSLLRMYGKGSIKTLKEKKEAEQRITELQSQACANKPNVSILNKLKEEMMKYREKMKLKKPIGKLIPEKMNFSTSDSNLKNVEL